MTGADDKAKWDNRTRDCVNVVIGILSVLGAAVSLIYAARVGAAGSEFWKRFIVGVWILLPPAYFWCDWQFLCAKIPQRNIQSVKHLHDLARNIWLALVVVLIALFDIHVFGEDGRSEE
jgi:hypothetical protein